MSNIFSFWLQSQAFRAALAQGQLQRARQILLNIQQSGAKFNLLEKQFYQNLLLQDELNEAKRELATIRHNYTQLSESKADVPKPILKPNQAPVSQQTTPLSPTLQADAKLSTWIYETFKLKQVDPVLWQCQGIDSAPFQALDRIIYNVLVQKLSAEEKESIVRAHQELKSLNSGKDPDYSTPNLEYAYFLEYFLDNVYASYLAWFFIYDSNCLKSQAKILDVAAGPGTVLFGLSAFLQTLQEQTTKLHLSKVSDFHVSYHFQEQQKSLQTIGLEIWQEFTRKNTLAQNTYWRIDTSDLFSYAQNNKSPLPQNFYDFIVISHCFFWDAKSRDSAYAVYNRLCQDHLSSDGYALFIIQRAKLFNLANIKSPNQKDENFVVSEFCRRIKLNLVWYKSLSSTGSREKVENDEFKRIMKSLPSQIELTKLRRQYLKIPYPKSYVLDDYLILVNKQQ